MSAFWQRLVFMNMVAALLLLLGACTAEETEPTALLVTTGTPTAEPGAPTPTPAAPVAPTQTAPAPGPTATPSPLPPTPTPSPTQPVPALEELQSLTELEVWLSNAYRQASDPQRIATQLRERCWIREQESYGPLAPAAGAPFQIVDLDGDGRDEWLVAVTTDGSGRIPCGEDNGFAPIGGLLWIIDEGLAFSVGSEPIAQTDTPPLPLTTADLTGDGVADVLTSSSGCGAHTCYSSYAFVTAHGGELRHALDLTGGIAPAVGDASPLLDFDLPLEHNPYPIVGIQSPGPEVTDVTGDGVADFVLEGGGVGSVGAGIHRTETQTWSWNGEALVLTDFVWNSRDFRHHALYDGNFYFALGQWDAAATEYLRAIYDDGLRDDFAFVDLPDPEASARASVRQVAAFRLILLAKAEEDGVKMAAWRDWLAETYPGTAITAAAGRFVDRAAESDDLQAICAQITGELEASTDPVGVLDDNVGYANPTLSAADVCPVTHVAALTAPPAPAVPALYASAPSTGRSPVDAVIDAVETNNLAALVDNLTPREVPCTTETAMGALPCAEGEADGTPVRAIQTLGCDGGYVRDPEQFDDLAGNFLTTATGVYAIYELDGETIIIFGTDAPEHGARLFVSEGVVGIDFGCAQSPALLLMRATPDATILLSPPAAEISLQQRFR